MKNMIWIEWVGIWGSGKSTCVKNLHGRLADSELKYNLTRDFFAQSKLRKVYCLLKDPLVTFVVSVRLFSLFLPFFIRAYREKDLIKVREFRSLLACYLARIVSRSISPVNVLWEGELHLLPIFGLNYSTLVRVINLLLSLNQHRVYAVVVMKVDEKVAFRRILEDEESGKNKRFEEDQKFSIERLRKFNSAQEDLIKCLLGKGIRVFESDGNLEDLYEFTRTL